MALVLHLTDLHLSPPSNSDAVGDYTKIALLTKDQFQTRTRRLRTTMNALGNYLVDSRQTLDSIVVSGDLTVAGAENGFALVPDLMGELGKALPQADRILIAPGNHDVAWSTAAGSAERYRSILNLRQKEGYRTAYLDGIDIDAEGKVLGTEPPPSLTGEDGSYILVAMNSSNNCGIQTETEPNLSEHLDALKDRAKSDPPLAVLLRAWERRGLVDLARIDDGHLAACGRLLSSLVSTGETAGPLRIVAMHHPLAPVTTVEELKPFEVLSNLGSVREWVANHDVDVVLHGHTHLAYMRHDSHKPFNSAPTSPAHRFVVVGGGTIGLGGPAEGPVASLISTNPSAPRLRPLRVAGIRALSSPKRLEEKDFQVTTIPIRHDQEQSVGVVSGINVDEVFERLLGIDSFSDVPSPLICRVRDGQTALCLPANYPHLPVPEDEATDWLGQIVAWWQRENRGPGSDFNHGERLMRLDGESLNQLHRAAQTLKTNKASSRAVAVLLQPRIDLTDDAAFPAFMFVHATISEGRLDLIAYFRKQEIPHWWPVNMAELATIQRDMVAEVKISNPGLECGSITTITAMPVAGDGIPSVSVPWLDRNAHDHRALLGLITPLLNSDAEESHARWTAAFHDWEPTDAVPMDGEPAPVAGLRHLAVLLGGLESVFPSPKRAAHGELIGALGAVLRANENYILAINGSKRLTARNAWREEIQREKARIFGAVAQLSL